MLMTIHCHLLQKFDSSMLMAINMLMKINANDINIQSMLISANDINILMTIRAVNNLHADDNQSTC